MLWALCTRLVPVKQHKTLCRQVTCGTFTEERNVAIRAPWMKQHQPSCSFSRCALSKTMSKGIPWVGQVNQWPWQWSRVKEYTWICRPVGLCCSLPELWAIRQCFKRCKMQWGSRLDASFTCSYPGRDAKCAHLLPAGICSQLWVGTTLLLILQRKELKFDWLWFHTQKTVEDEPATEVGKNQIYLLKLPCVYMVMMMKWMEDFSLCSFTLLAKSWEHQTKGTIEEHIIITINYLTSD